MFANDSTLITFKCAVHKRKFLMTLSIIFKKTIMEKLTKIHFPTTPLVELKNKFTYCYFGITNSLVKNGPF